MNRFLPLYAAALMLCGTASNSYAKLASPQNCDRVKNSIAASMDWKINNQLPDGLLTYQVVVDDIELTGSEQNIVRQVGTFWSMVLSLEITDTPKLRESINQFRKGIAPYIKEGDADGETIAFVEYNKLAKINSSALYLMALVGMKEMGMELTASEEASIDKLVRGMKGMEADHGAYWYAYYVPKEHNIITPYGSAEALLAFVQLAKQRDDRELEQYAYDQFRRYYDHYIKPVKSFEESSEFKAYFSWALQMLELIEVEESEVLYQSYVRPLIKMALDYRKVNERCVNRGCISTRYSSDGVFYEGIIAVWEMVNKYEQDSTFKAEYESFIEMGKDLMIDYQIDAEEDKKLIERANMDPKKLLGGFCGVDMDCSILRNDLNQHVTNGLRQYYLKVCEVE